MSTARGMWRQTANRGVFLMLGVSISASASSGDGAHWQEEVLLHDGQNIIVERTVERGGRHEVGQRPPYKVQNIQFAMPGTNQVIAWQDNFTEDVGSANFLPMLLDIFKSTPYIAVYPMGCLSYNKWGRPNPPYVIFKYQNREWQRIPLQELPMEIKTPNLLFSMPDIEVEGPASVLFRRNDQSDYSEVQTTRIQDHSASRWPLRHWRWGVPRWFMMEWRVARNRWFKQPAMRLV